MITVKIPLYINNSNMSSMIQNLADAGVKSIEMNITQIQGNLIVENQPDTEHPVSLKDVFCFIKREKLQLQLILNLLESNLENQVSSLVEEWDLRGQVKYTGRILPTGLSLWDRTNVFYNVENCLPTFYQFENIKKTHFDVIHYFLKKYKVKTFRIQKRGLTEELIAWAGEMGLALSVDGVETLREAKYYLDRGVDYVSTDQMLHAH